MEPSLQIALDQLNTLPSSVRIIVFHSNYAQQRQILAYFLTNGGSDERARTIYFRLDGSAGDLDALTKSFNASLSQDGIISATSELIVLDDADRADPVVLFHFVRYLLQYSPRLRIVLLSREVLDVLLSEPDLAEIVAVLPARDPILLWDYNQPVNGHVLEIRAFGQGRVVLDGQTIERWEGTLPRALFFFLIDRGMVTRDDIFSTFWPELSHVAATNVFHVTKHKIHQLLGGLELTRFTGGYYHIAPDISIAYDVSMFRKLLNDAEDAEAAAHELLLGQAITLSRGTFLYTLDFEWITARRMELEAMRLETILTLARITEADGRRSDALSWYLRAALGNLEREDIVLRIMELYEALAKPQDGLQVYERLRKRLAETIQIAPGRAVEATAVRLRQDLHRNGHRFPQVGSGFSVNGRRFPKDGQGFSESGAG